MAIPARPFLIPPSTSVINSPGGFHILRDRMQQAEDGKDANEKTHRSSMFCCGESTVAALWLLLLAAILEPAHGVSYGGLTPGRLSSSTETVQIN